MWYIHYILDRDKVLADIIVKNIPQNSKSPWFHSRDEALQMAKEERIRWANIYKVAGERLTG